MFAIRNRCFSSRLGVAALVVAASFGSAHAADLGVANQFNAFIFGSATTLGGHSDGAIAVGGAWNNSYESNQHNLGANLPGKNNIGILTGGALTAGSNAKVFAGSNAYLGGSVSGSLQMLGGGAVVNSSTSSIFSAQQAYSAAQSAAIRDASKQAIVIGDPNNINLNVSTNNLNGNRRTYEVQASQLSSLSTFNISGMTAADTLIIDVVGTSVNWGWQVNATYKDKILWNFKDATSILVQQRNFDGAILAPLANIDQRNNIQGSVIANTWNTTGAPELHFGNQFQFTGDAYEPVPEPATMAVLALGLGAVARRRRKA